MNLVTWFEIVLRSSNLFPELAVQIFSGFECKEMSIQFFERISFWKVANIFDICKSFVECTEITLPRCKNDFRNASYVFS